MPLINFSAAVHANPGFGAAVRRIDFASPFTGQSNLPIEWNMTTFAVAAVAYSNLRPLKIWHAIVQPIVAFAEFVEGESCHWPQVQKLDLSCLATIGPRTSDHIMRALLDAMPNVEELRWPMGCISDDVAEAFPSLRRGLHPRDSDAVVVALVGGRTEYITEIYPADPSQGPSKIVMSRDGVITYEGLFEDRGCDALCAANLPLLRSLEIIAWGNGNNVCTAFQHALETCKTLNTLRLPAWEAQKAPQLTGVLSKTPRGLKVLRLDGTPRPYNQGANTDDIVPPHVLMTLNTAWNQGGIRGLRRLEFCIDRSFGVQPLLRQTHGLRSLRKFCNERRISHSVYERYQRHTLGTSHTANPDTA